jgi:hypothetical protein
MVVRQRGLNKATPCEKEYFVKGPLQEVKERKVECNTTSSSDSINIKQLVCLQLVSPGGIK